MEFLLLLRATPLPDGGYVASGRPCVEVADEMFILDDAFAAPEPSQGATAVGALVAALVQATLPVVSSTQSAPAGPERS